jgi:hypothetical protein
MAAFSSVGRLSFTCVFSPAQYGQRIKASPSRAGSCRRRAVDDYLAVAAAQKQRGAPGYPKRASLVLVTDDQE